MRFRFLLGPAVLVAVLAASDAGATAVPARTQALQLAEAQRAQTARAAVEIERLGQLDKTLGGAEGCVDEVKAFPQDRQMQVPLVLLRVGLVTAGELSAASLAVYDRDLTRLHLTDPAFVRFAAALHTVADELRPLLRAPRPDICGVLERWQQTGYANRDNPAVARRILGLTASQLRALDAALRGQSKRRLDRAAAAANARAHALGVALHLGLS
ncbi:MAG TPA: hypothetical protein VGF23_19465 [Gaiellaceae bacterium]|jgi:hypothetical protein